VGRGVCREGVGGGGGGGGCTVMRKNACDLNFSI
jgi:hypothetical protein